ncbi:hypothetical protein ACER0C_001746 [Sarotherodon galilaeus]
MQSRMLPQLCRLIFKPQLCSCILHHTVILLILTDIATVTNVKSGIEDPPDGRNGTDFAAKFYILNVMDVSFSGIVVVILSSGGIAFFCKCKKSKLAKLQEQAQKKQEELNVLSELNAQLLELKRGNHQVKEDFRLLDETIKELAENKEKLQLVEIKIAQTEKEKETDKTERYLEEKQSLLTAQRKLEKRKEELENLQLNMEKQLQQIEDIISRMRERKTKSECVLEVIDLKLEEVEC